MRLVPDQPLEEFDPGSTAHPVDRVCLYAYDHYIAAKLM